MSRGRHRLELDSHPRAPRRPRLPVLPPGARRPVVAGFGAAVLGLTLVGTLWPAADPGSVTTVTIAGAHDDALAADARKAAAALRAEERTSRNRDRTTTPSPTADATATTAPAAKPLTPEPAPVPAVVAKRWVESTVNVRSGPSADATRIGQLTALSQVGVTGVTKSGWTQVVIDGKAGWVRSTYLSATKPKPKPAAKGVSNAACSISTSIEAHLSTNARAVYRAVCAAYGSSVSSFGGYRAGDSGDHGSGRAVDIMVSGDPGWTIARYVQTHADALNVTYVIYQQKIWMAGDPTSEWSAMEDRGSRTANHFDHVHVSVS